MVWFGADPPERPKGKIRRGRRPPKEQYLQTPDSRLQNELLPREPPPPSRHLKAMRTLLCLCLFAGLAAAGTPPQPGLDRAFLARILANNPDGSKPWKTFRVPEDSASATVEVVGEYTPAELRQVAFQEFLMWFQADLRRWWRSRGFQGPPVDPAAATLPVSRFGGNPVPQNVPFARVGF